MHARAGAQQGLFTGDDPMWLPFPVASVSAALVAVLGAGAALIKRASTGYGQHVETSLLDALLFLNAAAIFHREGHRPRIVRQTKSPILRVFDTADGRAVMVNLSGTERWRELCRAPGHGRRWARLLDAGRALQALRPRVEPGHAAACHRGLRIAGRPTSGKRRCWPSPPPSPSATRSPSGWRSEQARVDHLVVETRRPGPRTGAAGRPARTDRRRRRRAAARPPARRGAGRARRPPHRRPLLLLGRTAGVTAAGRARRRRREGGAARRRGRIPDDAGAAQHLCRRQSLEARDRARPQDPRGPGAAARPRGGVRRRGRERHGGCVGAARPGRGRAARRSILRSSTRGPRASGWRGRWPAALPSTTSFRRRPGWR